ncbi:putative Mitochondrial translation initiation factor [Taphrina deformans PYCC 5710]|uniref:Translation initiation factor IF-2, mitochondrial n=1 Tax=Taphrina deformans (strain PYCC 5710 / ATCC 11124 / CBS 356.35 / IMI 108563 / JCM 9778 / NBRC 8474) TaxID=1097556 RepID=R4X6X2_TAPDE|nr:putative Mitochondrial translation initiation factor [Taphrina deformans PYCC 5710]|eukprot:CCG80726.1 putative Mitochondrial translation initiation factor [Taphrina deformans PYCC 5710]
MPSKWARPQSLPKAEQLRPPPPRHPRDIDSFPRTTNFRAHGNHGRDAQNMPRSNPQHSTSNTSQSTGRTREEVLRDFRAKQQAKISNNVAQPNPPPTRFPIPATSDASEAAEKSRWAAKKAQDRLRAERQSQKAQTRSNNSSAPVRRKPKSAHLQEVRAQLYIPQSVTVSNLSRLLNVRLEQLQAKMQDSGFDNTTHDYVLTADNAALIAEEFNFEVIVDNVASFDLFPRANTTDTASLPLRPPLVTIMGHVDHGKTTLLDTLRKSSVAAKEAGGITQAIGAFSVKLPGGKQITFLDTPGHSAFEAMRKRGASVTDIVVLVVAADDSVMPQTKEAIKHAHSSGVNMIVAINKTDKPGVDVEKVKRDLMSHGVEVEDYGGDIQSVPVSGLTGKGLDDLENAIVSLAEILDIRAESVGAPEGWVIESSVKKGRGNVASMIVKRGTLKTGSYIVAGQTWCRVRAMSDEAGKPLKEAGPGCPVEVTGWAVLPIAGDEVLGSSSEKEAKQVTANRQLRAEQMQQLADIEAINAKRLKEREDALKVAATEGAEPEAEKDTLDLIEVPLIVKGDVSGSVEAVVDSVRPIGNDEVRSKIIDSGVGEVSESDVLRAAATNGKILAFNVAVDNKAKATAAREGIQIISHNIIYRMIDDVRDTLASFLTPIKQQRVLGEAEILKVFNISTKGRETKNIAGCRITNGTVSRTEQVRVVRKKQTIWQGKLAILKHVKQEVATLGKGNECGMEFEDFQEFEEGDAIQCYTIDEIKRTL